MYDKNVYKRDVTCSWPLPCHKLSHLLEPPSPSSVTYFMDGPIDKQNFGLRISNTSLPRILSDTFVVTLKGRYINLRNEWMNISLF